MRPAMRQRKLPHPGHRPRRRSRRREPQLFDRLSFLPGEEMQVDYGEGAPTRVPGTDRYR